MGDYSMTGNSKSTTKILEIENDPHILDFMTYDNVPIWMIARFFLLYNIIGQEEFNFHTPIRSRRATGAMITNITKTFFHNIRYHGNIDREILLYSTNRKTLINGKYFNRYVDQLYQVCPTKSFVIEQPLLDWSWPYPRMNKDVY